MTGYPFPLLLAFWLFAGAGVSPETVVATINGRKITAGEVDRILLGAPGALQQNLRENRKLFIDNYALVSTLAAMAEKEGLDQRSPYREQLAWLRQQVLMQAAINRQHERLRAASGEEASIEQKLRGWLEQIGKQAAVTIEDESKLTQLETTPEDAVVAAINGARLTAGELQALLRGASPQVQQNFRANPRQFLTELARMRLLVAEAEKEKLAEQSPCREQLEWVRSDVLSQALLNDFNRRNPATPEEEKKFYEAHQANYEEAKVKVIYIAFAADPNKAQAGGRKLLTEQEARAKIESLRRQALDGADFAALARQHSHDETSAAKDGDLGVIRRSDQVPDAIKAAIFSLKPGQVSEVVAQPNGFYLFRLEEMRTKTLDEVRQEVNREAQSEKFREWFDSIRKSVAVTYENEAYFSRPTGGAGPGQ
jgi:peptidyl-prolyl cis-trans isomerase C